MDENDRHLWASSAESTCGREGIIATRVETCVAVREAVVGGRTIASR